MNYPPKVSEINIPTKYVTIITMTAIPTCSKMPCKGLFFCLFAIYQLRMLSSNNPRIALTIVAVSKLSNMSTGMANVIATRNFAIKVAKVDSRISLVLFFLSDSSEICTPSASENASAMAIVKIPPMTAIFRCVPKLNQTISPSVVMIHEVIQNANQVLSDCFIKFFTE